MKPRFVTGLLVSLFLLVSFAFGQTTFTITGTVTSVSNNGTFTAPSTIHVGDTVTTVIVYNDPSSSQISIPDPSLKTYSFATGFSYQSTTGSYSMGFSVGNISVINNSPTRGDTYTVATNSGASPGQLLSSVSFGMIQNASPGATLNLLSSQDLIRSASDVNLGATPIMLSGLFGQSNGPVNSWNVSWSTTPSGISITSVSSIPEPGEYAVLCGLGSLLVVFGIKRKR